MSRFTLTAITSLLLAGGAPAQGVDRDVERVFYEAFFVDQGLKEKERGLTLYRRFLALAPDHPLAGQAARLAIKILEKGGEDEAVKAMAAKHAAIMAETIPVGINSSYLDPNANVTTFVRRFEAESREVFKNRRALVKLMGLQEGQTVADIGAGTGFFSNLFARAVGPDGAVLAVEIAPTLIPHLRAMGENMKLANLKVVRCTARSTELEAGSVDVAFICDVYHHFAYPADTMKSLYRAMRPGGQLFVIDFERIPGVSRPWVLDHVRAGKGVFRSEIEAAGFVSVRELKPDFLEENYILQFAKRAQ